MNKVTSFLSPIFAIVIAFSLLLSSCIGTGDEPEPTEVKVMSPDNDQNPYDHAGLQHNEDVNYLTDNFEDEINALKVNNPLEAEAFIFEKMFEKGNIEAKVYQELRAEFSLKEKELLSDIDFLDVETVLKNSTLNAYEKKAMQRIVEEVTKMPDGTPAELNAIIKKLISIEAEYLKDQNIENDETFFGSLSVMRHSAHLWGTDKQSKNLAQRPRWGVVAGDAIGFVIGYKFCGVRCGIKAGSAVSKVINAFYEI